ncbi:klc-2 [Symbiodinium natans]|uniref:Klc-2 protein n=1 Tax=Symbiodinium natans TaxID=878477 RepID=A0A812N2J6_9DINO|nr:klc-2 [Symbiodinium natans]
MGAGASAAASEAVSLPVAKALKRVELSEYFSGPYLEGKLYSGSDYSRDLAGDAQTFKYEAPDGPVHVWQFAFDARDLHTSGDDDFVVLYHYCNELAFTNICNEQQTAAELFASLVDTRAHFGKGIYATRHEPSVWGSRTRVLLNNYSNGSPLCDANGEEARRVLREWGDENPSGHRAAFCLPILAPKAMAYNIFEQLTPDMSSKLVHDPDTGTERPVKLGEDYKGRAVDPARDVWVVRVVDDAGAVQNASAETDGLLQLMRRRLALLRGDKGDTDMDTLACMHELASRLQARGQHDEAEQLNRECLTERRSKLGDQHPHTLISINNLAGLLEVDAPCGSEHALHSPARSRLEEAEPLYREALEARRSKLGDQHPDTLISINNLAALLEARGRLEEAEPLYREALKARRSKLGDQHPDTLISINNLAALLKAHGRLEEAEPLYREALEGSRTTLGGSHPHTLVSVYNLACLLETIGQHDEAEKLYREELEQCRAKFGATHEETLSSTQNLARFLQERGKESKLAELLEQLPP